MNLKDIRNDFMSDLESVNNYEELGRLVLEALVFFKKKSRSKKTHIKITQVCGPISTGGLGSVEKNIEFFTESIQRLINAGYAVFDQVPFEEKIWEIKERRSLAGKWFHYDHLLLEKIYKPLFESGLLDLVVFLPDYQSSVGARWEYDQALENGIQILGFDYFDEGKDIPILKTFKH